MTIVYDMLRTRLNVHAMPDYEGVGRRFLKDFEWFIRGKKYQAACAAIREEFSSSLPAAHSRFIQSVADRIPDDAIQEKRFVFLAINTALCI